MNGDHDAGQRPQTQLEYAGGGPGVRVLTAIGAGADDSRIDSSVLPNPPLWFKIYQFWKKISYCEKFRTLPLDVALLLLERAQVPPLYRLGLGLKWGFIEPTRDGFSPGDFAEILKQAGLHLDGPLDPILVRIEKNSTYQIWRKLRLKLDPLIDTYWHEHPGFTL